jgi:hypothetical protein
VVVENTTMVLFSKQAPNQIASHYVFSAKIYMRVNDPNASESLGHI